MRNAKGWSRPELGRQMAQAIGRNKPFAGELIRLYEEDENRPSPEARAALAQVFERSEIFIEFGVDPARPNNHRAQQPEASYAAVSKEALEIARAFDQLQPQAREFIREQVFIYTVIDKSFPWLRHGRPMGTTYAAFEKWHQENIETKRDLENQKAGRSPRSMKERTKR